MINNNEHNTYEDTERAIIKRLLTTDRKQKREENIKEILTIHKIRQNKFKTKNLTIEYLRFLLRYYTDKNNNNINVILHRFLKTLDINFNDLNISVTKRTYKKLIVNRIEDFTSIEETEQDASYFEDLSACSYLVGSEKCLIHTII